MAKNEEQPSSFPAHGASELPEVTVDSYNIETRDADGFIGDKASSRAFRDILEEIRAAMRAVGEDPLGDVPTGELKKKEIDAFLRKGDVGAAGVVQGAIEEFAQDLAKVIRRFLRQKAWHGTERIVAGGGLRGSRVGELAIGRATALLKLEGIAIEIAPVRNDPDEAGLIGGAHLAPPRLFSGRDGLLAVDIGGSNIRAGVVRLKKDREPDLATATVWRMKLWRYAEDDRRPSRDGAVASLVDMLRKLAKKADRAGLKLAPFIGIGCPGRIDADGSILQGGQNLPGNWETPGFNLPDRIRDEIPEIDDEDTVVMMHNDAVVQGLSEAPWMRDVTRWGVLTIGTGLGNARFTNRRGCAPETGATSG